ncbi:scrapie-responsive protein 1 isoform X1 [Apus apus]|uniref:scrapie-responsive protein 1 isoform X1 n=1 Tax=Apus apus TaxID=8895 RepID=UPI0021F8667F|nr:scrapie-responsive protein 1 isoform X1 [Apus apus]
MPTRCEHVAEHGKSRPEEVRLFNLGVPPNRRASQTPCSLPPSSADGSAAARGGAGGGAGAFPPSAVGNGHSSTHRSLSYVPEDVRLQLKTAVCKIRVAPARTLELSNTSV